jgi:ABC-type transporter Mla maintaining outer membrane lipid asymmetry ATPase subunit MlaF
MSVEIRDLHIEYPEQLVFENVSLSVADDEIIAIETQVLDGGTSLLKGIAGFLTGVAGTVDFEGYDLLQNPPEHVQFKVGYVYEEHGLLSIYSVVGNIALPLQFHTDMTPQEIGHEVEEVCRVVGIPETMFHKEPHQLNDVQARLVNLARALVARPKLLLIDELEGGMSDELLEATMKMLRQRQQQHPMAIIITTSSDLVMDAADRVYHINNCALVEGALP